MSCVKNESDSMMLPNEETDECSSEGAATGGGGILKKGPWTAAEDKILKDYVTEHGEGNWNAVQKYSGLSRCGKSCRLRWANHLRPHLKKCAITPDEERRIIELHAKMGNKWARMASLMPGRTDNEIKNYWNTRIKRRQRAGLPLYPPELSFESTNGSLQSHGATAFTSLDNQQNEILHGGTYDIFPNVMFDHFKPGQEALSYLPSFSDYSVSSMIGTGSKNFGLLNSTSNHIKRFRESETLLHGFNGNLSSSFPTFEQFSPGPTEKCLRFTYPYEPDSSNKNMTLSGGVIPGSHALPNVNFSTSRINPGTVKLELPSIQYPETDLSSWLASPPTPVETVDTYIQSPPAAASAQSDNVSPRNCGLLEALLHEGQTLSSMKNQQAEKSSSSSGLTPSDMMGSSTLNFCGTDWGGYSNPSSPLHLTAASVFCETPISGSSLDEFPPYQAQAGFGLMLANDENISTPSEEFDASARPDPSRPDVLLGSDWLNGSFQGAVENSMLNDALATLLGDGLQNEQKHVPSGEAAQELELESFSWNNMPRVCQISEIP